MWRKAVNEFTKDELEELKYFLFGNPKSTVDLCRKIQSLIDNYCDHKNIGSISDIDYLNICKDCHEIQEWA